MGSSHSDVQGGLIAEGLNYPQHAHWLGVDWRYDAIEFTSLISSLRPNYVVVDSYAIEANWENHVAEFCEKLFVIDDLADRPHVCDILLDQNLGKSISNYSKLVTNRTFGLYGPTYSLLRPEFNFYRSESLRRREKTTFRTVLITMGGIDKDNVSGAVLDTLNLLTEFCDLKIKLVVGRGAPWKNYLIEKIAGMNLDVEVSVDVKNMAEIMTFSDLAIGAAGATSWERCCLGLPAVTIPIAENQKPIANALELAQASYVVSPDSIPTDLAGIILKASLPENLKAISDHARSLVDGLGCDRVVEAMVQCV
jgi:UDP-2,4-diacetamido-2,4,6-trideoxy-beta-L-altropyranose hydrolase